MFYKHDHNLCLPVRLSDRLLHAYAFLHEHPISQGGLGAYGHLRKYIDITWPNTSWDPWAEIKFQALADPEIGVTRRDGTTFKNIAWAGCAAAGKTWAAALYALAWFSVDPTQSTAILCSSSKQAVRRRVWPVIQDLYTSSVDESGKKIRIGHMLDSQTRIQSVKGDDLHAVSALAIESGELQKAIGFLKGIHSPRILLIVDEADCSQPAIFAVVANLRKACESFTILSIGNAVSYLDPHGRVCEPKKGWDSVTIDTEEWITKGVAEWNIEEGVCQRFDGVKSPNVKARKTIWPYLYTWQDYEADNAKPDFAKSIAYFSFSRGWWPPEGSSSRIITPQLIVRTGARERFTWLGSKVPVASLDPAFGGNDCVLMFGWLGDTQEHTSCLELSETMRILIDATSKDPADYQIAKKVMEACQARGVEPRRFGMDCTGTGRGVSAFLSMHWSADFVKVEFGGNASDSPFVDDDLRPASEVCSNRVTELWWRIRSVMAAGRLRGLSESVCQQLCMRPYTLSGRRYRVMPKDEMKELNGKSPDEADSLAVLVEVARRHGLSPMRSTPEPDPERQRQLREANDAWSEIGSYNDKVMEAV